MSIYIQMIKGYVFNESFNEEESDVLYDMEVELRYLNKTIDRENDPNLKIQKYGSNFVKKIKLEIISGTNEERREDEWILLFGMQYLVSPFHSDILLLDPDTFSQNEEDDRLVDEAFEELLNSEHLSEKFKDRSQWSKKLIMSSLN